MRGIVFVAAALACLVLRYLLAGRQLDATPLLIAFAPINAAAFTMRRALAWTRGRVKIENERKSAMFSYAGARAVNLEWRERELRSKYRLEPLHAASSAHMYRENLYVLDLLDRHANVQRGHGMVAVDVGSQDFRYAFGLARWLGSDASLTGIELEGHRIYRDLHSRKDHADAFVAQIDDANVSYEVGDFLAHDDRNVDVAFFFFPFILEYALLRWGLPRRFFRPERIFEHAHRMLRPGGTAIVMNHTEAERRRQVEVLEACGFEIVKSHPVSSDLVDYAADVPERSITIARKSTR